MKTANNICLSFSKCVKEPPSFSKYVKDPPSFSKCVKEPPSFPKYVKDPPLFSKYVKYSPFFGGTSNIIFFRNYQRFSVRGNRGPVVVAFRPPCVVSFQEFRKLRRAENQTGQVGAIWGYTFGSARGKGQGEGAVICHRPLILR